MLPGDIVLIKTVWIGLDLFRGLPSLCYREQKFNESGSWDVVWLGRKHSRPRAGPTARPVTCWPVGEALSRTTFSETATAGRLAVPFFS